MKLSIHIISSTAASRAYGLTPKIDIIPTGGVIVTYWFVTSTITCKHLSVRIRLSFPGPGEFGDCS